VRRRGRRCRPGARSPCRQPARWPGSVFVAAAPRESHAGAGLAPASCSRAPPRRREPRARAGTAACRGWRPRSRARCAVSSGGTRRPTCRGPGILAWGRAPCSEGAMPRRSRRWRSAAGARSPGVRTRFVSWSRRGATAGARRTTPRPRAVAAIGVRAVLAAISRPGNRAPWRAGRTGAALAARRGGALGGGGRGTGTAGIAEALARGADRDTESDARLSLGAHLAVGEEWRPGCWRAGCSPCSPAARRPWGTECSSIWQRCT